MAFSYVRLCYAISKFVSHLAIVVGVIWTSAMNFLVILNSSKVMWEWMWFSWSRERCWLFPEECVEKFSLIFPVPKFNQWNIVLIGSHSSLACQINTWNFFESQLWQHWRDEIWWMLNFVLTMSRMLHIWPKHMDYFFENEQPILKISIFQIGTCRCMAI